MGCRKSGAKREVYSNISLPQETRETSNKQPNCTPKAIRKRRRWRRRTTTTTKKPKVSTSKEIIKTRTEINEKTMRETVAKINKTKS